MKCEVRPLYEALSFSSGTHRSTWQQQIQNTQSLNFIVCGLVFAIDAEDLVREVVADTAQNDRPDRG
jgi:hypothetical protein